jgi:hypothetical protein
VNNAGAPSNPDGSGPVMLDNTATPGKLNYQRFQFGDRKLIVHFRL